MHYGRSTPQAHSRNTLSRESNASHTSQRPNHTRQTRQTQSRGQYVDSLDDFYNHEVQALSKQSYSTRVKPQIRTDQPIGREPQVVPSPGSDSLTYEMRKFGNPKNQRVSQRESI